MDFWPRTSHGLTIAAATIALICLIGYLYDLPAMYGAGLYTSLALHTIFGVLLLCVGLMASRPQRGLTILVSGSSGQGFHARLLLAVAVCLPLVLGWIALHVQRLGGYGSQFTLALFSDFLIILSVAIVWISERGRQTVEQRRYFTAKALIESEARLRLALQSASIGIWSYDALTGTTRW